MSTIEGGEGIAMSGITVKMYFYSGYDFSP
jgi:hypothetical protein